MGFHESFKFLGLLSIMLTWASISFILAAVPISIGKSISHHAALSQRPYRIFALGMTLGVLSLLLFLIFWFIPLFRLSWIFVYGAILAVMLELAATWVPLGQGWRYNTHQTLSYAAALLMPVLLITVSLSPHIHLGAKTSSLAGFSVILVLTLIFFLMPSQRKYYLLYQVTYIGAFTLGLIGTAYLQ